MLKEPQLPTSLLLRAHSLEDELSSLIELPIRKLREIWRERVNEEPPAIRSRETMVRLLAWHVQVAAYGGLDRASQRKLAEIATILERDGTYQPKTRRDLSAGLVITREWRGVTHKIIVTGNGFQHQGKNFKSLSSVARAITGTRWSGPRFFGLGDRTNRLPKDAS